MRKTIAMFCIVVVCLFSVPAAIRAADTAYEYAQVTTQRGPLNMRETASTKAKKIDEIPKDTIITIISRDDTWCACLYDGQDGYVMTKFLTFMDIDAFNTLSVGDSGQDVLKIKERLQELYFYDAETPLDDRFDDAMVTAINAFQMAQGMEETGTAPPELQALLFWGPAKNNRPTVRMVVKISCSCSGYNHVGNNWSEYFSINGEKISSGTTLEFVLGDTITIYSKITERDKSPDVGSAKKDVEITQDYFDNGFTVTQKISVREDKGRYAGSKAQWTVVFTASPE